MEPSGTVRASGERLAAALLPALLHRVQNNTQLLVGVRAMLQVSAGNVPSSASRALATAGEQAQELGWLLGVLADALGTNLLLAREERAGLAPVLLLTRDALGKSGRTLRFDVHELPLFEPVAGGPSTARRCAAIAWLALEAGESLPAGEAVMLRFALDDVGARIEGDRGAGEELARAAAVLTGELGAGAFERDGASWCLHWPREWFTFRR